MPAEDGSVRIACDGTDLPTYDNDLSDVRAFAFDSAGRSMAGWPVRLRPGLAIRVVGDQMTYLEWQIGTDTANVGVTISHAGDSSMAPMTSGGSSKMLIRNLRRARHG